MEEVINKVRNDSETFIFIFRRVVAKSGQLSDLETVESVPLFVAQIWAADVEPVDGIFCYSTSYNMGGNTEFIARQADIASETSITSLWEFFYVQNILVHVPVLNAHLYPLTHSDTLSINKNEFMEAFPSIWGNILVAANLVKQTDASSDGPAY
ncbi:hypothetical protein BT96DRAFT_1002975 [Gymnopus androsaceus JB14]|uniref:Uncharacterized protein n=1 Tax=Gymnopus androsaceus JB14 TaxID=1447944 RepID=A0A6A4GX87_9AGAR|nr:hypothetical protein BT96DRAFT_1002975 [Gymnopus androsaceus JB14]